MSDLSDPLAPRLLTLTEPSAPRASVRAKAMLFHDPRGIRLLEEVELLGPSGASVLLIGETGTGKELIARRLHDTSGRRGPFLAVNCGAFSESLVDAELFGHESGAYTGAVSARAGWFEAADGGTLFLDEIGDLPPPMQVKLLRVLQERQVVRLGSRRATPVDVRLVAATHLDLRQAVEAQRFRADLYYRLGVATLRLPPLRERPGDILPLARHFALNHAMRVGGPPVVLSMAAQALLQGHPWPGNIRELENVIHYATIVCRGGIVQAEDLNLVTAPGIPAHETPVPVAPAPPGAAVPSDDGPDALDEAFAAMLRRAMPGLHRQVEARLVQAAWARAGRNQVATARMLGVTRNTARTLLRRHGLMDGGPGPDPHASEEPTSE